MLPRNLNHKQVRRIIANIRLAMMYSFTFIIVTVLKY